MEATYLPTGNSLRSKGFKKSQGTQTAKLKSIAGATHVAIEEAEEIGEDDFNQLADSLRSNKTKIQIFRIWNPPNKDHFLIKNYFNIRPSEEYDGYYTFSPKGIEGHCAIISSYKDNYANLNEKAIKRFEAYKKSNLDHYLTDIVGLVSSGIKGQIYKDWQMFKTLPDRNWFRLFGVDFGFVNDPTAVAELFIDGDRMEVYIYERFYQTGAVNRELIQALKGLDTNGDEIVCDNSEPSEVSEMIMAGLNAFRTKKGGRFGNKFKQINVVKGYKVFYHEDSKNLAFEQNNAKWAVNPDTKEPMNKPVDKNDHLLDAIMYAINYYNRNFKV
jgi:phage terminase large subunit